MHADGSNWNNLTEMIEVGAEFIPGFAYITPAGIHGFIMKTHFVAEGGNFLITASLPGFGKMRK